MKLNQVVENLQQLNLELEDIAVRLEQLAAEGTGPYNKEQLARLYAILERLR